MKLESGHADPPAKPVRWMGGSKRDLSSFPASVRSCIGSALWRAQVGQKAPYTKPLKGFAGAGVVEILADAEGDAYRAVYTVRFAEAIYVLHAFQKKSKRGIAMPKGDIAVITSRLRAAREDYERWSRSEREVSG